jgi:BNR repeat-containing family member
MKRILLTLIVIGMIMSIQGQYSSAAKKKTTGNPKEIILNQKDTGYRGIWYYNQPSHDEYVYKYSGGMGTYCAKHIPHAVYAPEVDKTFFTYGGTAQGSNRRLVHMVSYYDHKTGMVPRPTILLNKKTSDAHDNPVISIDDKGYIWIFSSSHGTGRPSYISRSKTPYSIDEFELKWTGNYSYPQPWYIPGEGFLFIHVWYGVGGRSIQMMKSVDGVNWSKRELLSYIHKGHYETSRPCGKKVGVAFNYHPDGLGLNYRTNLYYMETEDFGETWKTVSGETLTTPVREVNNPALVRDYEWADTRLNVYVKDLTYDSKGCPIVLYITSLGYESGPENMPRTWTTARWTGSEWDIRGSIVSDNNYDMGSLYVESDNLWCIMGPTEVGPQPYNPGGEIAMWVSRNQGKSWKKERQMTKNSPYNHTYLRRPLNVHPDFAGFWADGHGRKPSDSRLYFCNNKGDVFRLPVEMKADFEKPARVE